MNPSLHGTFQARLVEKRQLTPIIYHLRLKRMDDSPLTFVPGQFLQLIIAPRVLRQYSVCSFPGSPEIELCVDISPGGQGSHYVLDLAVGDVATFRGPFGVFVLPPALDRPLVFIATGAGIAPIRPMIAAARLRSDFPSYELLFGNRTEADILYNDDFRRFAEENARFSYTPTLSQPSAGWKGTRGRVTEVLHEREDVQGSVYYICGSPQMVDDTRAILTRHGVSDRDIHFEKYI